MQTREYLLNCLHKRIAAFAFIPVLLLSLTTLPVLAEEPADSAPTTTASPPASQSGQQKTKNASPEFIPTEEISEDLSVPFPVDI